MKGTRAHMAARALAASALGAAGLGLIMLPDAIWLAGRKRLAMRRDGHEGRAREVVTIGDAVAACRETGLQGRDLVAYAQHLVYRKFAYYSVRNLWDTPARAFEFGMGYCTQYNLALKQILDRLGFHTQAVSSTQVRLNDRPEWRLGHTWLRVTVDGKTLDVCAGRPDNLPGKNGFVPVKPVWRGNELVFFLTNLGMMLFAGSLSWRALLTGRRAPEWTFVER